MNQWLKFQPKREHVSGFCAKGGERLLPNCYKKEPVIPINIWVCHQQTLTLPENSNDLKGTVARDFLATVFFLGLPYMGLRFRG